MAGDGSSSGGVAAAAPDFRACRQRQISFWQSSSSTLLMIEPLVVESLINIALRLLISPTFSPIVCTCCAYIFSCQSCQPHRVVNFIFSFLFLDFFPIVNYCIDLNTAPLFTGTPPLWNNDTIESKTNRPFNT